ncbi:unnamed protein product, partial [Oppiella nova]
TGTGLEGGVNAIEGGVCIDLTQMNKVIEVNEHDFDCTVEAGINWRSLNQYLRDTGLYFPIDPGASASIGGMTATSASGTNAVAFGTMKQNVLNLEVVLPDGRVVNTSGHKCRSRKSSAGYDLTSMFIGSEGTLGTITKICLKLSAVPECVASGVCSFPDDKSAIDSVIETLQSAIPVARVEYLDDVSIKACRAYSRVPLTESPTLFLEFNGSTTEEMKHRSGGKETVMESETRVSTEEMKHRSERVRQIVVSNGGSNFECSSDPEERKQLWKARHELYYALKSLAPTSTAITTDVCVPVSKLTQMIVKTKELLKREGVMGPLCGHVGDGNFHAMLFYDPNNSEESKRVHSVANDICEIALQLCGTCAGEHGIGREKIHLMYKQYDSVAIDVMNSLKLAFDPKNLMNPQKIF